MSKCCGILSRDIKVSLLQVVNATLSDWSSILFLPVWNDVGKDVADRHARWIFVVNGSVAHQTDFLPLTANLLVTPNQKVGQDIDLPNGVSDITAFLETNGYTLYNGDEVSIYAQIATRDETSYWSNPVTYRVIDENAQCQMPLLTFAGQPLLTYEGLCLLPYSA
jgi:hypothetical protein